MKRTAILLVVALAGAALADTFFSVASSTSTSAGVCTSLSATAGANLGESTGYSLVVSADRPDGGAQTLVNTGTVRCCKYGPVAANALGQPSTFRWMPCQSTLDFAMSTCTASGQRDCTSGDYEPLLGFGRVAYLPDSLWVDGGTTVTTTITVRRAQ